MVRKAPCPIGIRIAKSPYASKLCQPSPACLLVERGQIVSGLFHHLHHSVEADRVRTVRECGEYVGVEGACSGVGVTLYARYLHEAAYRVAREA